MAEEAAARGGPGARASATTWNQHDVPDGAAAAPGDRASRSTSPSMGGFLRSKIGTVYAVDGVDFDDPQGRDLQPRGRVGLRQVHARTDRAAAAARPPPARSTFAGEDLTGWNNTQMRPYRKRMQIIFQDPFGSLNPRMPVSDIIGEGLLAQGMSDSKERTERIESALEAVGLRRSYTRRFPHEFCGGQRQRIGIARALALEPEFIVCDEPVSALDVSIQSQILNLLLDLRSEFDLTYLFISHNLSVVEYFSDRVGGDVPGPDPRAGHGRADVPLAQASRTPWRCCRRSRSQTPASAAAAWCSRVTCRPRPHRPTAAASIPAAGCASTSATPRCVPPRIRGCATWAKATRSGATSPRK